MPAAHNIQGDLYQMLRRNKGPLKEDWVCRQAVVPLLSVLVQLQTLHVIHRDIKPEVSQ